MLDYPTCDLLVRTHDPEDLARILAQLPMANAYVVNGSWDPHTGVCRVRAATELGAGFVRFAIPRQGYGEIVGDVTGDVVGDISR